MTQNAEDDRRLTDQDISPLGRISRPIHRLVSQMKTIASNPKPIIPESSPPPGSYQGTWGGYKARFYANGHWYEVDTFDGIRTPAAPCVVTISEQGITVESAG